MNLTQLNFRYLPTVGQLNPFDIYSSKNVLLLARGSRLEESSLAHLSSMAIFCPKDQLYSYLYPDSRYTDSEPSFDLVDSIIDKIHKSNRSLGLIYSESISKPLSFLTLNQIVHDIYSCATKAPDLSLSVLFWRSEKDYSVAHCVATAILASILASNANLPENEIKSIIVASLMMNSGMNLLQNALLSKNRPDQAEYSVIREHPESSANFLKSFYLDNLAHSIILNHHERNDLSGYPLGVKPDFHSEIVGLSDWILAKMSNRLYRSALLGAKATKSLIDEYNLKTLFSKEVVQLFLKSIGLFIPGNYIKLSDGKIALVRGKQLNSHLPEVIEIYQSQSGTLIYPRVRKLISNKEISCSVDIRKLKIVPDMHKIFRRFSISR